MMNVVTLKPKPDTTSATITVTCRTRPRVLVDKFVALNQGNRNSHGPMSWHGFVTMLFDEVAAFMRPDGGGWRGGHMSLVMSEHGYHS